MANALVDVRSVSKTYHRDKVEVPVLRKLSLTVNEGD